MTAQTVMPSEARAVCTSLTRGSDDSYTHTHQAARQQHSTAQPYIPAMFSCIKLPLSALACHPASRLASSCAAFVTDKAFIDGQWVDASRGTFEVRNPDNGQVLGHAANCGEKEVDRAIDAAKTAFESFSRTPSKTRGALLRRMHELQMQRQAELANLITQYVSA